jgi:hypothetical protein
VLNRVSTEFRRYGIPRNFLTSEEISAQFRRNSAKFRGIPRNFAGIAPEITSVFRGMPKCHFRGRPSVKATAKEKPKACCSGTYDRELPELTPAGLLLNFYRKSTSPSLGYRSQRT